MGMQLKISTSVVGNLKSFNYIDKNYVVLPCIIADIPQQTIIVKVVGLNKYTSTSASAGELGKHLTQKNMRCEMRLRY